MPSCLPGSRHCLFYSNGSSWFRSRSYHYSKFARLNCTLPCISWSTAHDNSKLRTMPSVSCRCFCGDGMSFSSPLHRMMCQGVAVRSGFHGDTDAQDYSRGKRGWRGRLHDRLFRPGELLSFQCHGEMTVSCLRGARATQPLRGLLDRGRPFRVEPHGPTMNSRHGSHCASMAASGH